MKLATRYQRSNLLITLVIFVMASCAFYVLLHQKLVFQVDEDLEIEQREIEGYAARYGILPKTMLPVEDQVVQVAPAVRPIPGRIRRTVRMRDQIEGDYGDFRQLVFTIVVGGQLQQISVSKSLEGTRGLTRSIGLIALTTIAVMLLVSLLMNRIVLQQLWKPFYKTIERLRAFDLSREPALNLPIVPIEEFALLNETLDAVTARAAKDYIILKEFTENAAHELQTPLAIVRSKLDLLIQDAGLSEGQSRLIQDAYDGVRRLTYLNRSLLELAKIESGQYPIRSELNMADLLNAKLDALDDMVQEKGLQLYTTVADSSVWMNERLADMLLNNLLTNAIRHNAAGGRVSVDLNPERMIICNTSLAGVMTEGDVFLRFSSAHSSSSGTGLGLAISKQICEVSGCTLDYAYVENNLHCFTVRWNRSRD